MLGKVAEIDCKTTSNKAANLQFRIPGQLKRYTDIRIQIAHLKDVGVVSPTSFLLP